MECLTGIATEAVPKLGKLVLDSTVEQFKYIIHHKKIVEDLEQKHEKLKMMRTTFEKLVEEDRRQGSEAPEDLKAWFKRVIENEDEFKRIYEKEAEANKKKKNCCSNLAFNYSSGKRATECATKIAGLIKEKEEKYNSIIRIPKSPPKFGPLLTQDIICLGSRNQILKKVMEKLKDEKVKRISICGMPGVGKTTLAKEVINSVEISKLFGEVAIAAVSQDANYENIQKQIAEMLHYKLKGETMQVRAAELHRHVTAEAKSVLIVLDDIWRDIDFKVLGLPSLKQQEGCKILFTSRDVNVCKSMKCDQENIINVPVLSEPEAWELFREMAGNVVADPDINEIAKEVAKGCGGLPLSLVTVARTLANGDKYAWHHAQKELRSSSGTSLSNMQEDLVYSCVELSINFLRSPEKKYCLLLCGLYPEDKNIPIESLLRQGIGMEMFRFHGAIGEARNQVHTLIDQLKWCFLLLDSDKPGCVKMHDVVRNVVISIANLKSTEQTKLDHINAISLVLDDTNWLESDSKYQALQLLQVHSKSKQHNLRPEHFFQGMSMLKVLGMENLCIPSLRFQAMANLHTLRIEYCDVGDVSVIGMEFPKLQVLSFAYSNIEELPTQIGELGSLRLLDLTGCNDLCFISLDVFGRLCQLEELYFGVKNFPWIHHKEVLEELQSLANHIKVIEIKVRKVEDLSECLTLKNLEKFWVYLVPYSFFERQEYLQSNTLQVTGTNSNSLKNSSMIKELFKKCETLILEDVKNLKNISELDESEYPIANLKDLNIDSCPDLDYLFHGNGPHNAVSHIQSLSLNWLPNLREICNEFGGHSNKTMIKFSNLVKLELLELPRFSGFSKDNDMDEATQQSNNHGLETMSITKKLFPSRWVNQFPKLETILLEECKSLEMVFDLQGCASQRNGHLVVDLFPQLKEIKISNLSNLIHVWGNVSNHVYGFQNLRSLSISSCKSLMSAFTPAITRAFTKLETLEVKDCELMKSLVAQSSDKEHEEGEKIISFKRLESIILWKLPNIGSICPSSWKLELPSLTKLEIYKCPKLRISTLLSAKVHDSNFEENHPRMRLFGCTLFRSKNKMVDDHVPANSERKFEMVSMPCLEELNIDESELHEGNQERIRDFATIDGYLFSSRLTSLIMKNCDNIIVLLSLSTTRTLECLKKLEVKNCQNVEQIICQDEKVVASENKFLFPSLQYLVLQDLPNLKAICQGSVDFDLPSLRKMEVQYCPNLEMFSQGYCQAPEDVDFKITGLHSFNYIQNGDLNSTIQGFKAFDEEALLESKTLRWNVLFKEEKFSYFKRSTELAIKMFHKVSMFVPSSEVHVLRHLWKLNIEDCNSLVELFESEGAKNGNEITYELRSLTLRNLPKLRHLWGPNIERLVIFNKLTSITIVGCKKLKSVLSESVARSFVKLQELSVSYCMMMEEIVTMEDGSNQLRTLLPDLEKLSLRNLPRLECVCSRIHGYDILFNDEDNATHHPNNNSMQQVVVSFPKLKEFYMYALPIFKCFYLGGHDYDAVLDDTQKTSCPNYNVTVSTPELVMVHSFHGDMCTMRDVNLTIHYVQNREKYKEELRRLEISTFSDFRHYITRETRLELERCCKLLNCVPSNMMQFFQNVKQLKVIDCKDLQEIFELNDYCGRATELRYLELQCLPNLKHVWRNHGSVSSFENLTCLTIKECHELKFLFPDVSAAKSLPQLQELEVVKCNKMEEIFSNNNPSIPRKGAKIILPYLYRIELEKLINLSFFSPSYSHFELPRCWHITIQECLKMQKFCFGTVYTPALRRLLVEGRQFDTMEDVNEVIKEAPKSNPAPTF